VIKRRKGFGGARNTKSQRWKDETTKDRIKCKKCGVFEQ